MTFSNPNKKRPGFTLVEMLTVIVIIGILAGLTVGAGIAVRNAVKRSIIVSDIKQLELALQKYKTEIGELPPDFANVWADASSSAPEDILAAKAARSRVVRHLRKAFPRLRLTGADDDAKFNYFVGKLAPYGIQPTDLNPSTALTLWLGGPADLTGDGKPLGFHEDATNPFKVGEPRKPTYYDFDTERLNRLQLMQPGIRPPSPIVYFRAVKNKVTGNFEYGAVRTDRTGTVQFTAYSFPDPASSPTAEDYCVPYLEAAYDVYPVLAVHATAPTTQMRTWRAPDSYQIIAAGLDGKFSNATPVLSPPTTPPGPPYAFRFSTLGENFSDADYDNLASFADGELEDEL